MKNCTLHSVLSNTNPYSLYTVKFFATTMG